MIKSKSKYILIFGTLIFGIGSCGIAACMPNQGGDFSSVLPAFLGWMCIMLASIFLIIDTIVQLIIKREFRRDFEKINQESRSDELRNKKLNLLLNLNLVSTIFHFGIIPFFFQGALIEWWYLLGSLAIIYCSFQFCLLKYEFGKMIWIATIAILLFTSILSISGELIDNKISALLIIIPLGYHYIIQVLLKSPILHIQESK